MYESDRLAHLRLGLLGLLFEDHPRLLVRLHFVEQERKPASQRAHLVPGATWYQVVASKAPTVGEKAKPDYFFYRRRAWR